MKKSLITFAVAALFATQALAEYVVILKDGTRYVAKSKWTMQGGKAIITLQTGSTLQLDPALIDVAKSEQVSKLGLGNVNILNIGEPQQQAQPKPQPGLGSSVRLRQLGAPPATTTAAPATAPSTSPGAPPPIPAATSGPMLSDEVVSKFARAYENVGLYEQKLTATGPNTLRAELTADSEDKVFNAISATSFLMVRNAGVSGARIDLVELFMKTTTGGSSGRFQMNRADAEALDKKQMTQQDYFVKKVIF
jgi:hypothetical protein